jgi:hypothetical protein
MCFHVTWDLICYPYLSSICIPCRSVSLIIKHLPASGQSQTTQLVTGTRLTLVLLVYWICILAFCIEKRNRHAGISMLILKKRKFCIAQHKYHNPILVLRSQLLLDSILKLPSRKISMCSSVMFMLMLFFLCRAATLLNICCLSLGCDQGKHNRTTGASFARCLINCYKGQAIIIVLFLQRKTKQITPQETCTMYSL